LALAKILSFNSLITRLVFNVLEMDAELLTWPCKITARKRRRVWV